MNDKVHIALVADGKYWPGLEVTRRSIIESCGDAEGIVIHSIGEEECRKFGIEERIRRDFGTYKGSPMTYVRMYLAEMMPDLDWIVYADVDTLWRRDVRELGPLFDPTKTIQWVKDVPITQKTFCAWARKNSVELGEFDEARYACAGICIINLKAWRERNVLGRCVEFSRKYPNPPYADQDVLNAVLQREAGFLPACWDVLIADRGNVDAEARCVLHLTGVGRCFGGKYEGKVIQYRYWMHVAFGMPFRRPSRIWSPLKQKTMDLLLPFLSVDLRCRIRRYIGWRWFLSRFT